MKRALLLYYEGTARSAATEQVRAIEERGWEVDARRTEWSQDTGVRLPADVDPASYERLVVAGGDGTLRDVVAALGSHASTTPVSFLPSGNANVLAIEFGIARGPRAVDVALNGEEHVVDAFEANGKLGLAMVGVGIDATVTRTVHALRRSGPGCRLYSVPAVGPAVLYCLGFLRGLGARRESLRIAVDGARLDALYHHFWAANTATYGTGWSITARALAERGRVSCDGMLDWHGSRRRGRLAPVGLFLDAMRRRPSRGSDYGQGARIVIEAERPFGWQMDGDPQAPTQRLEVVVRPAAWRIRAATSARPGS